jgi:hypothetical protein
MKLKTCFWQRALPGNYSHAHSLALSFAGRTGLSPAAAEGKQGTKVNTHTAPGSRALPNVVLRDGGLAAAVSGGRRQSRRSRIPAALLSVSDRDGVRAASIRCQRKQKIGGIRSETENRIEELLAESANVLRKRCARSMRLISATISKPSISTAKTIERPKRSDLPPEISKNIEKIAISANGRLVLQLYSKLSQSHRNIGILNGSF